MANDLDKNQKQEPQQKHEQEKGQHNPQDSSKKNPGAEELPERKDREGSEDVEKRRAS